MAWTDEARAAAAATRKAKAKHPAKGAKVAKAVHTKNANLKFTLSAIAPRLPTNTGKHLGLKSYLPTNYFSKGKK